MVHMATEAVRAKLKERYGRDFLACEICGQYIEHGTVENSTKHGVISCVDCKNFVFKTFYILITNRFPMIPSFVCKLRNSGHCKLPPTKMRLRDGRVISQIKLRCDACWLNLCVSTFKLPRPIKDIVVKMLPEDLRVLYPKETDVEEVPPISPPAWLNNQEDVCESEEIVSTTKTDSDIEVSGETATTTVTNDKDDVSNENNDTEQIVSTETQEKAEKMNEVVADETVNSSDNRANDDDDDTVKSIEPKEGTSEK